MLYLIRLNQASIHLDARERDEAHRALSDAFRIGKTKGYEVTLFKFWQPDEMARLCAEALNQGIEVDYAKELIRRHELVPPRRPDEVPNWPWPVAIRTLGSFEVSLYGKAVPRKQSGRPFDLLKVLISLGSEEVRQETIEDDVWPDAEGDVARIAFKTNLSRLRKIIGVKAVEVEDGRVSLNRKTVWLDLWAFEDFAYSATGLLLNVSSPKPVEEIERLAHKGLAVYRGDFMPGDDRPSVEYARARLKARFARAIDRIGALLTETGEGEKASALADLSAERGIELMSRGRG